MSEQVGWITEIRSLSAHDGPGLRTSVFFKGCSLKCIWCHNPETIGSAPELEWDAKTCIDCRICEAICPEKAIAFTEPQSYIIDKNRCTVCGICVDGCPTKALRLIGASYTVDQLFDRIHKDEKFIKRSNGGITFSGGEPALQYHFITELAQKLKASGYHLALDTCGAAPAKAYEKLVPLMDLILYDLKEMNDKKHRQFTGSSNKLIHKNLLLVLNLIDQHQLKTELWIRTPLIPGMTDTPENIRAIGEFLSQNNRVQKWELCTFNNLCIAKYRKLGRKWDLKLTELLTKDHAANLLVQAKFTVSKISSVTLSGLTKTNQTN